MIVIEDERACVIVVALAADASGAGAEVTIGQVIGQRRILAINRLAVPGPVLSVRGDNNPFLTQGMPSFFPDHKLQSKRDCCHGDTEPQRQGDKENMMPQGLCDYEIQSPRLFTSLSLCLPVSVSLCLRGNHTSFAFSIVYECAGRR